MVSNESSVSHLIDILSETSALSAANNGTKTAESSESIGNQSTDLLGLTTVDEFCDFMSSASLPYMPSQLLLNDFIDIGVDDLPKTAASVLSEQIQPSMAGNKSFDIKPKLAIMELFGKSSATSDAIANQMASKQSVSTSKANKGKSDRKDKTAWFKLFAELDPLANPDLMEKKIDDTGNNSQAV